MTRHVVVYELTLNGRTLYPGDVYYLNEREEFHREDGPAIIQSHAEFYYQHGKPHRDNDLPAYEKKYKFWWRQGVRHRVCGPTVSLLPSWFAAESDKRWQLWGAKYF